jgi:fumarylpyruvate hydrolase
MIQSMPIAVVMPAAPPQATLAVHESTARFPVRRLYCIGRNYADHAREMGMESDVKDLFFFTKWPDTVRDSGARIPYPPGTTNFHHEVELVVAIGKTARNMPRSNALDCVFGYAVGLDLTRRDLQFAARDKGRPWDAGKNFDAAAPIGPITSRDKAADALQSRLWLEVNGQVRQDSNTDQLLFPVDAIIAHLSSLYVLEPGDVIMTGTPAGVGPLQRGDQLSGRVAGLEPLEVTIV